MARKLRWLSGAAFRPEAAFPQRPRRGLTWPLRGLLAASLAIPLLLLAIAAWQNFRLVKRQAEVRVAIEAGELEEHDLTAFKTYPLALAWIDERIRGQGWASIEHDQELHRLLSFSRRCRRSTRSGSWTLPGASAPAVGSTRPQPLPTSALRKPSPPKSNATTVSSSGARNSIRSPIILNSTSVSVERRPTEASTGSSSSLPRPDISAISTARLGGKKGFQVFLVRSRRIDPGELSRQPKPGSGPGSAFLKTIASGSERAAFRGQIGDGRDRAHLCLPRHFEGYPVDVIFGVPTSGVIPSWRANLVNYLLFAIPASLALFGMTFLAARQVQRQKIASWRWRTTARRLRREMDRRAQAEAELLQAQKIEALGQMTEGSPTISTISWRSYRAAWRCWTVGNLRTGCRHGWLWRCRPSSAAKN